MSTQISMALVSCHCGWVFLYLCPLQSEANQGQAKCCHSRRKLSLVIPQGIVTLSYRKISAVKKEICLYPCRFHHTGTGYPLDLVTQTYHWTLLVSTFLFWTKHPCMWTLTPDNLKERLRCMIRSLCSKKWLSLAWVLLSDYQTSSIIALKQ